MLPLLLLLLVVVVVRLYTRVEVIDRGHCATLSASGRKYVEKEAKPIKKRCWTPNFRVRHPPPPPPPPTITVSSRRCGAAWCVWRQLYTGAALADRQARELLGAPPTGAQTKEKEEERKW